MSGSIRITNISDVLAGFHSVEDKADAAAQYAISVTGLKVERQAKINANGPAHLKGTPRIPGGRGPNTITGNLKRSITTKARKGFGTYIAEVSATMSYARHVELGGPNWKPGVKYPFLGPAVEDLNKNGNLSRYFTLAFASRMKG